MKYLKILFFLIIGIFLIVNSVKAAPPQAITDLRCSVSQTRGSVWLLWNVPSGSPTSYDVRYSLGAINSTNYDEVSQFTQNWAGTSTQGLVIGLAENKRWFFAMKAINNDGTSDISNVADCFISESRIERDETPPTSLIISPKSGETILADKDYIIYGTSSDTGGSSVQKVEISLDGGKTWQVVAPKASLGTGFSWEYAWINPVVGSYTLKSRATDWWNNIETPSEGINLTVAKTLEVSPPLVEKPVTPPAEKPISEMTESELKEKIVEIQKKIIELLNKLIQLLRQKITGISD